MLNINSRLKDSKLPTTNLRYLILHNCFSPQTFLDDSKRQNDCIIDVIMANMAYVRFHN